MEQNATSAVRTVYDFPVAAHLCSGGVVRYTKLVRRPGVEQPRGTCGHCQTEFEYRKPKASPVRHIGNDGASHF